ncbi:MULTISPECIES: TMEM175 family protein [Thermomonospora]|uniref:DUF1211 domain-containing protein n=1 Tax=Thermomonospora curvata (strain ATCC 19995 / DSM 43183 / JCM 3096 / KCTC 9072 / NBRC 15933 / NCIMB 10081 / Henssen B9) TaxID=471852 RepID=D1A452_THECD|nr:MULTISPECIES: TMEM175 family protein [Thermomonospora]ACY99926.1 protein of unknown function DUF1211 [Thermomonospora curvata DSM 43183]PKK12154.1 MAG: DUF1211 domain-containing protein [Thermomonospora sp. CIF 1]
MPEGAQRSRGDGLVDRERLLGFADAVIAIAITLLALGIQVPAGLTEPQLRQVLHGALPDLWAYALSFAVIGLFWLGNHGLFAMVAQVDGPMVMLELALLACIAILPFPTRLISDYGNVSVAVAGYAGTLALAGALMTVMSLRLRRPGPLRAPGVPQRRVRSEITDNVVLTLVFGVSAPVAFLSPSAAMYLWLLLLLRRVAQSLGGRVRGARRPGERAD